MVALACRLVLDSDRALVSGETDSEPVENIFGRAQQVEAEAENLLVDADWARTESVPEPGLAAARSSGDEPPFVELVPGAGHDGQDDQQKRCLAGLSS